MKEFSHRAMYYFEQYNNRQPYKANPYNPIKNYLFQFFAICTVITGFFYIEFRITKTINPDNLWFSLPLLIAEILSMIGTLLVIISFWEDKEIKKEIPVQCLSDIEPIKGEKIKSVSIDIFITTYNEELSLLKYTIADCKNLKPLSPNVSINIIILDDGKRDGSNPEKENLKEWCENENVRYISRKDNIGFKAGNLKNGIEKTNGELFVILDADTRIFPHFLINTTGYFRNPKIAWVQTPQWFYDINEGQTLNNSFNNLKLLQKIKNNKAINNILNTVKINKDILGNDSRPFYDIILRRRNYYNAAFCCGAGSIHRRKAVVGLAVNRFSENIRKKIKNIPKNLNQMEYEKRIKKLIIDTELNPFVFHASEDMYTSILLHSETEEKWESIQHPEVECKMLSTQDLNSRIKQFKRYAEGTIDIAIKNNPLQQKGLSLGQKICYITTIWSYLSPIWLIIFILSPIIYFFSLASPVTSYTDTFVLYFITFQITNTFANLIASWGISTHRSEQYYVAGFWYMITSIINVISGKKIIFNVTPKTTFEGKNIIHIIPHLIIITIGIIGIFYNIFLILNDNHPDKAAFLANSIWFTYTVWSFSPMIRAAFI